jgi:selenocysteine-specific translation elongation factor
LNYRGFAGQVASGRIAKGDPIMVMPSGKTSRVAGIDLFDRELDEAVPPLSVTIRLTDEVDVSRGDVLIDPRGRPQVSRKIEATVIWMNERPLDPGRSYLLKHAAQTTRAFIDELVCGIDLQTLAEKPITTVGLNDIARIRIRTNRALVFDPYGQNRTTGAFILIDSVTNDTVGAGMILSAAGHSESETGTQISESERAERLRQKGAVVRLVAKDQLRAESFAYALERRLFDLGYLPAVSRDEAEALALAGLLAICPGTKADPTALEIADDAVPDEATEGFVARLRELGLLR